MSSLLLALANNHYTDINYSEILTICPHHRVFRNLSNHKVNIYHILLN